MTVEARPQSLIPPTLMVCPRLDPSGTLELRPQTPLMQHFAGSQRKQGVPETSIRAQLDKRDDSLRWFPEWLAEHYEDRLKDIDTILCEEHQKLEEVGLTTTREPGYRKEWTKRVALRLFPDLEKIVGTPDEQSLFRERTLTDYIDQVALPNAFGFVKWAVEQLPPSYHQPLELLNEVNNAEHFINLVRLYSGGTVITARIPGNPNGMIYNSRVNHEVMSLLQLMYVATIADVARFPEEEYLLTQFTDQVSGAFPREKQIYLSVTLNKEGKCKRMRIDSTSTDHMNLQTMLQRGQFTMIPHPYSVRSFGSLEDEAAIFEQREKEPYPKMLKLLRNRDYPLGDNRGARFILLDKIYLEQFIAELKARLKDWDFEKEEIPTKAPESQLDEDIKYFASIKDQPKHKIEIQIHWLRDNRLTIGDWTKFRYESGSNPFAYRVDQLIRNVLPVLSPPSIYLPDWIKHDPPLNWDSDAIRLPLIHFADTKALL